MRYYFPILVLMILAVSGCVELPGPIEEPECKQNSDCNSYGAGYICSEDGECRKSGVPTEPVPTCRDNKQNQGEEGVDCGGPCPACAALEKVPIRGLVLGLGRNDITPELLDWIKTDLKNEGINVIQWRIGYYHYGFTSHPEVRNSETPNRAQVKQLIGACREAGIYCYPGVSSFSHQGDGTSGLIGAYPKFDIAPATEMKPRRPTNKERSWNPYNKEMRPIVNELAQELIDDFEAKDFMVGYDEAYMMPTLETDEYAGTPGYNGEPYSEVYAYEFKQFHDYLSSKGVTMWVWGDELLNYRDWGKWDENGEEIWPFNEVKFETDTRTGNEAVHPAIDLIPRDNVIIADWHYSQNPATAEYFASKGFDVVTSPWNSPETTLAQVDRHLTPEEDIAPHMKGILFTTWVTSWRFMQAWKYGHEVEMPSGYRDEVCNSKGYCFYAYELGAVQSVKQGMAKIRVAEHGPPPQYP